MLRNLISTNLWKQFQFSKCYVNMCGSSFACGKCKVSKLQVHCVRLAPLNKFISSRAWTLCGLSFVLIPTELLPLKEETVPQHALQALRPVLGLETGGLIGYFIRGLYFVWNANLTIIRMIVLASVFFPLMLLYPLTYIRVCTQDTWNTLLLRSLEFSGPVFVKLGQWASTRRDLFPEELCNCLSKLQRRTKSHSWFYTRKSLEKAYGNQWHNIFLHFDNDMEPVGSGCCAQVYKAWIDLKMLESQGPKKMWSDRSLNSHFVEALEMIGVGWLLDVNKMKLNYSTEAKFKDKRKEDMMPVAVKVLHPRMEAILRRDLNIMRAAASVVTWLFPSLRWLSLRDCVDEFAQLMEAQIDFCIEAENLERFAKNFKGTESVKFPVPVWPLTRPYILVETYEEGHCMQNYCLSKANKEVNVQLANLGINTILKMHFPTDEEMLMKRRKHVLKHVQVFDDNFAHGDLHPGNILVHERVDAGPESVNIVKRVKKFLQPEVSSVGIVILDCGIVASLDEQGKSCLRNVFSAVVKRDGRRVAELFLQYSKHQCTDPEKFKQKMEEIVNAALDRRVTLEKIDVSTLMTSLFSALIEHKVKLDGSFSAVILAIMVLEGLGRTLDPTLDIVEKARPFLLKH